MSTPVLDRLSTALSERYRIERELGAGGMATVYLARDVRHDRRVALKVLRPELAAVIGAERFLHEIKTTANLQHPHILPLHDSGEAAGLVYYVMPYVEGEALRDRLTREHQLPVEEAVRIAREVADALDYAHRHGVVHRDIKPENILLHDGRVQVADFGIALAVSSAGGGTRMTETGMSLGTPHYMAPEQAMGEREITPKADIYALGCVLYEMLVGEPPFTGPTAQAIIARVMTEEPRSLTIQRRTIPVELEAVVRRALEKLPADRFASAAGFSEALAHPERVPAAAPAERTARLTRSGVGTPRFSPLLLGLGGLALAAAAVALWALTRPEPARPVSRYALFLPEGQASQPGEWFQLSPDGSRLVYSRAGPDGPQLWIKERDRTDATPLAGTLGAGLFTFSPDGRWIAFRRGAVPYSDLFVMPAEGGTAQRITELNSMIRGFAWMPDSNALVMSSDHAGEQALFLLGRDGRGLTPLGVTRAYFPAISRRAPVLVYQQENSLTQLASYTLGAAGSVGQRLAIAPSSRSDHGPSLSPSGKRLAFISLRSGAPQLWVSEIDTGLTFPVTNLDNRTVDQARWSPDERELLFISRGAGASTLMRVELATRRIDTLSEPQERVRFASFARDGKSIFLSSNRSGTWQVWRMWLDEGRREQLTEAGGWTPPPRNPTF